LLCCGKITTQLHLISHQFSMQHLRQTRRHYTCFILASSQANEPLIDYQVMFRWPAVLASPWMDEPAGSSAAAPCGLCHGTRSLGAGLSGSGDWGAAPTGVLSRARGGRCVTADTSPSTQRNGFASESGYGRAHHGSSRVESNKERELGVPEKSKPPPTQADRPLAKSDRS